MTDKLKQEAEVTWGLKIGPKSTQRDQNRVLFEIIDKVSQDKDKEFEEMVESLYIGGSNKGSYLDGVIAMKQHILQTLKAKKAI
jgi:hypothetical protein